MNLFMKSKPLKLILKKHNYSFLNSFYADFGPLNLAVVHRYCTKLNKKLNVFKNKYLVFNLSDFSFI